MQDGSKKAKTSVDLDQNLWRKFKSRASARGLKIREALEQAIHLWFAENFKP